MFAEFDAPRLDLEGVARQSLASIWCKPSLFAACVVIENKRRPLLSVGSNHGCYLVTLSVTSNASCLK